MKTLSNAELQDAIDATVKLITGSINKQNNILIVHLENLTDEQRYRATDELTLEPMTTTLDRVAFEARAKGPDSYHLSGCWYGGHEAQDGPKWRDWDGGTCRPVPRGNIVSIGLANGEKIEKVSAGRVDWGYYGKPTDVACYCDWTAWEQSK